jgi:uncharacterized protein (TIGR00297 family)
VRLSLAPLTNFDIGGALSAFIAFAAFRLHALDGGGALTAFVVGTAVFGGLGPRGALVLLAFFTTSVALSRYGKARKRSLVDGGKDGPRNAAQVLANGGIAAACALLAFALDARYASAFAGALGAATADTWGTEIGTLAQARPRSVLTFRPIATGLSGGVSLNGTLAEACGALFIAGLASACGIASFGAVLAGALAGAFVDSLLGASLQSLRWCPNCERACESEPHACGANTTPLRGLSWFGNDGVNLSATLVGAAVAFAFA